jgi:5'-methylthioadenosine phosphorylase
MIGIYCVGSLTTMIPPGGMVLLDQFIDFSMHREATFFQGGDFGLGHTDMVQPYCPTLRQTVLGLAREQRFELYPTGTYLSFNGPRFETAAEIRLYASWGADVIGMTGAAEATLAREAGLHFAAAAYSVNYGAGLMDSSMKIENADLDVRLPQLMRLSIQALRQPFEPECICDSAILYTEKPKVNLFE